MKKIVLFGIMIASLLLDTLPDKVDEDPHPLEGDNLPPARIEKTTGYIGEFGIPLLFLFDIDLGDGFQAVHTTCSWGSAYNRTTEEHAERELNKHLNRCQVRP